MAPQLTNRNVLISGAGIAGTVLAYWLHRRGFTPTVVERAPTLRKTGGHAVDLFGAGSDVVGRMGILDQVREARTRNEWTSTIRPGRRPVDLETRRLAGVLSDRHVEVMRDDLGEILYDAARNDVEYLFGDSIRSLGDHDGGVEATFESGTTRRFDLVVGADGLHSNVRRLVFGDEARYRHDLGAAFAVLTVPNRLRLRDRLLVSYQPGRLVALYGVHGSEEARAVFVFRRDGLPPHDHRDVEEQKQVLRAAYGDARWSVVPRLLEELDRTPAFYLDTISQIRMEHWSAGRVTLVGDAGYCPGPVVGGSTSLAVVGAYVLAGELAAAGGDHRTALTGYERTMLPYVRDNRRFALRSAGSLLPDSRFEVWRTEQLTRLVGLLPVAMVNRLVSLGNGGFGALTETALPSYPQGHAR